MWYQDAAVYAQAFSVEAREDTHLYSCLSLLALSPATHRHSAQCSEQFASQVEYCQHKEIPVDTKLHCLQQNCN